MQRPRLWALVMAMVATVALVSAGYVIIAQASDRGSAVIDDGPTFHEALADVNASVDPALGGPWTLFQVYGVASTVPVDPSSWGWSQYDAVLAACQPAFNGLTLWNGTLPLFNGTYNSGTAPFWQFVFFSNASQQILVATDVLGVVHVYSPISFDSPCARFTSYASLTWNSAETFSRWGFPGDTPAMAEIAWRDYGAQYLHWLGRPAAEMFLIGGTYFGSGQAPATQTQFFTCGTPEGVGATAGLAIYADNYDTSTVSGTFNYTLGCTPTADNWSPVSMELTFSNTTSSTADGTVQISQSFSFNYSGPPPFTGPGYNTRGVTSWMIGLNLENQSGNALPVGGSTCTSWVVSVSRCLANDSGWFVVLLAPDGAWEGTFGAASSSPSWSYPVLPIANNESLVLVVPSSWNVSGDRLVIASTASQLPLTGSVELP